MLRWKVFHGARKFVTAFFESPHRHKKHFAETSLSGKLLSKVKDEQGHDPPTRYISLIIFHYKLST